MPALNVISSLPPGFKMRLNSRNMASSAAASSCSMAPMYVMASTLPLGSPLLCTLPGAKATRAPGSPGSGASAAPLNSFAKDSSWSSAITVAPSRDAKYWGKKVKPLAASTIVKGGAPSTGGAGASGHVASSAPSRAAGSAARSASAAHTYS